MKKTYSVKDVWNIIIKNIITIACFTLAFGALTFLYAKHKVSTTYSAERLMLVEHHINYSKRADSQLNANLSMIPTYQELIESHNITDKAYKQLPKKVRKDISKSDFNNNIDTKNRPGTLIIKVKAEGNTAKEATQSVNQVVQTAKTELPKMQKDADKVTVYQKASTKDAVSHTHNSVKKYTIAGLALGFIFGMIFSFLKTSWGDFK